MTLNDLFASINQNPTFFLLYLLAMPLLALLIVLLGKESQYRSPWKQAFGILIYLVSIPGIFAVALNCYLFLFQRGNILEANLYTQLLPVVSLITTFWIISRNVYMSMIPWIGTISGLWLMLFATMILMFFLDRTRIFVMSYLPFSQLLLLFLAVFGMMYFGWRKFIGR